MSMHFWLRNGAEMEFDDVTISVKNNLLSKLEIEHQNFFFLTMRKNFCVYFFGSNCLNMFLEDHKESVFNLTSI